MRIALLGESPADMAVLKVLVAGVLGQPFHEVHSDLRARGWPNVIQILPAIIRHLHFNTTVEALVVTCDSDDSVVHTAAHDAPGFFHPQCRLCQLRAVFRQTTKKLPPAHGRERVFRCVGVAVPALEAWLLCGRDPRVGEAGWIAGQQSGQAPYSRAELKFKVYGTDRPGLAYEIQCAVREAERQRQATRRLENDFPGFAALAEDLRAAAARTQG